MECTTDVDECMLPPVCTDESTPICINKVGGFECACLTEILDGVCRGKISTV